MGSRAAGLQASSFTGGTATMSGTPSLAVEPDGNYVEFQAAVLRQLPRPDEIDKTTREGWTKNQAGLKKFLAGLVLSVEKKPLLVLFKKTMLGEVGAKNTRDCMTNRNRWYYRDGDIDQWLPRHQGKQEAGSAEVYQLQKNMTFREIAAAALGVGPGTGLPLLASALKERELLFTLPAIEEMVERQEKGEEVGLRTDGWANFAFVEGADESVSVAEFGRSGRRWCVYVDRLDYDFRWLAGDRLLVRNSAPTTL